MFASSEQSPTLRDVKMPAPRTDQNQNVELYSHPRLSKTRNLATRCRSVSLDRYLFWKSKQLAKDFNMFGHTDKVQKMSTCDHLNSLNRCISLPKIINSAHVNIDTMDFCESSKNVPFEENILLVRSDVGSALEKTIVANGNQGSEIDGFCHTDVNINTCRGEQCLPLSDTISEDHILTLNDADCFPTTKHDYSKADSNVNKVGHAFSLDTHLRVKNGQLAGVESEEEKFTCQQEANKEDAFIQGRHCSCPCLHSADHFSKAITTCIDLGRAERPVSPETTGVDFGSSELRTAKPFVTEDNTGKHGKNMVEKPKTEHKPIGCSHSQSEVLDKIFRTRTVKDSRKKSSSSKAATVIRVGSWPQCVMTSNQCLKSHGSSGDIDSPSLGRISSWRNIGGSADDDDVFDEGLTLMSVPPKTISDASIAECNSNNSSESTPMAVDTLSVNHPVPAHGAVDPKRPAADADLGCADSLSGSQASLSSSGTSGSKGKKMPSNKRSSGATKSSFSKPKSTGVGGSTGIRALQQSKQSRLEQVRQKNCGIPSLSSDKGQANKKMGADFTSKSDVKVTKRHSMVTVPDVKSHISLPRPSLSKRPMSSGGVELAVQSMKEGAKSSKLPVIKKVATPLQVSKPAASSALEKESTRVAAQRRHTTASSRPPLAPTGKKHILVSAEQKAQKGVTTGLQKSVVKGKGAEQKMMGEPAHVGLTGPRGTVASASKTQQSRVLRSSSSTTAKSQPARGTKAQPSSTSSRPTSQTLKQNARKSTSSQRHSPSKLPRKVSVHSTTSDTVSVASSSKDIDHVADLDDQILVCTEAPEQDEGITLPRNIQHGSEKLSDATSMPKSNQMGADQELQKDKLYTIEMPPRTLPLAPDILSETPCLSRHSVGTQVGDEGHLGEIQDLREKEKHVHQLVKERTDLLHQLQQQTRNNDVGILGASLVIFSVVRKLKRSHKYTSQLQRKIESTLQEMKQIQERLVEEEANNIKLQEEMMYQSSEHAVAMETLKADYDNILEQTSSDLKAKHAGEITLAIETHKANVHELKQLHEKELTKLKGAHEESIKSLKEEHRDEIVELESSHSSVIDELVEEHQVEIETIKTEYEEQNSDIKEKYNKLVSECSSLNKKLQSVHEENQSDIEARIQEAIKEYETLPAELESIKTVLEMRNAEIKQLRKEKMEKHLEIEKLSQFNARIQKLQHENESLSFVVESKSKFERQLSVERDSLRNSLEKEAAKSKRLSLENEELQWRLINNTSPLASPSDGSFSLSTPNRRSLHLSTSPPDFDAIREIDK